jgi:hypothetical protein
MPYIQHECPLATTCYIHDKTGIGMTLMIGLGTPLSSHSVIVIQTHWTSLKMIGVVMHMVPFYEMLERVKMMERLPQDQGAQLQQSLILSVMSIDCQLSPHGDVD